MSQSALTGDRFHRGAFVWVLYGMLGLFSFLLTMVGPMVPYLRDEFKLDYAMVGLHQSAFAAGMVLTGLLASRAIRRFGIARCLWLGMLGMLAGLAVMVFGHHPWLSLAGIFAMSVAGTVALAAIQTSMTTNFPGHGGLVVMEANMFASLFSMLVPLVLLGGAALGLGWRAVLPFSALVLLAFASFGVPATRRHLRERDQAADSGGGALGGAYWRMWLVIFLGVSVEWSIGFWCMSYLSEMPGVGTELAAYGTVFLGASAVIGRLVSSRVGGRLGPMRVLLVVMALILVGFPAYWGRINLPLTLAGLFLCGFGAANFYPLTLSLAVGRAGHSAAKASSYATIASGLAVGAAPFALGRMADALSMRAALLYVPVGVVLIALVLWIDRRWPKAADR